MNIFQRLSVKTVLEEFKRTCVRFPLPVVFSVLTSVLLIIEIENFSMFENSPLLEKSIFVSILGFFFTLVSTLHVEKCENRNRIKYIVQLIVLSLLAFLFMTLPSKFRECDYITFSTFLASSFFALMFVYTRNNDEESYFGIYNINLFMRGFTSFVFSVILFAGLASATFAIQELFFKDNLHEEIYDDIWAVIISFFAPVHFMSGLPDNKTSLTENFMFPKPLKLLLQYILVPLVSLYLLILYSYIIKIVLTQIWPAGIVSYLIISYSLVGIVTVILLSPLKNSDQFKWINTFSRYFFIALLPLIVVLFMAILKRISQYGITEKRYFIFALSLWLAGITLYMVFSKRKTLKLLPVTLSIVSVMSLYGPWSCFSVSRSSQLSILEGLLLKNDILVNGEIKKADRSIPFEDRKSISSIISYFYDNHGIEEIDFLKITYQELASKYKDDPTEANEYNFYRDTGLAVSRKMLVKEGLGFDFIDTWQNENSLNNIVFSTDYNYKPELEDISDYESFIYCYDNFIRDSLFDAGNNLYLKYDEKNFIVNFKNTENRILYSIDLQTETSDLLKDKSNMDGSNNFDPSDLTVIKENDSLKYKIVIRNFTVKKEADKQDYKLQNIYFRLYYTIIK